MRVWDFHGCPGVKNPPSHAGNTGSIPRRVTKILHGKEQQSPAPQVLRLRVLEPVLQERSAWLRSPCAASEAAV